MLMERKGPPGFLPFFFWTDPARAPGLPRSISGTGTRLSLPDYSLTMIFPDMEG